MDQHQESFDRAFLAKDGKGLYPANPWATITHSPRSTIKTLVRPMLRSLIWRWATAVFMRWSTRLISISIKAAARATMGSRGAISSWHGECRCQKSCICQARRVRVVVVPPMGNLALPISRRGCSAMRYLLVSALFFSVLLFACTVGLQAADHKLTLEENSDGIKVLDNGKLFTEYLIKSKTKPILWPINAPNGLPLTRSWPMSDDTAGEKKDHPHHRSLWFTHGDVNGVDFWMEEPPRTGNNRGSPSTKNLPRPRPTVQRLRSPAKMFGSRPMASQCSTMCASCGSVPMIRPDGSTSKSRC